MYGTYTGKIYDPEEEYLKASKNLEEMKLNQPKYEDPYDQSLQDLYQQITQRPRFTYDPGDDALYQSYKQSYGGQGRLAMEDTMGQAAGLTGGYGSSYAQSVGQQQYDAYLQKLNDVYPELYSMAYNQYLDEGKALQQEYDMLFALSEADYEKYWDQVEMAYRDMQWQQEREDVAYDRMKADEKEAYNREQKNYDRLVEMIITMGYVPTAEELVAAGMSDAHLQYYLGYFNSMNAPVGGGGGKKGDKKQETYDSVLADARADIAKGASVEEVNGRIAQAAAAGEIDVETARELITVLSGELKD